MRLHCSSRTADVLKPHSYTVMPPGPRRLHRRASPQAPKAPRWPPKTSQVPPNPRRNVYGQQNRSPKPKILGASFYSADARKNQQGAALQLTRTLTRATSGRMQGTRDTNEETLRAL